MKILILSSVLPFGGLKFSLSKMNCCVHSRCFLQSKEFSSGARHEDSVWQERSRSRPRQLHQLYWLEA